MSTYRIVFAKDEIISCVETDQPLTHGLNMHYENQDGQIAFALINASNAEDAINMAKLLVAKRKKQKTD